MKGKVIIAACMGFALMYAPVTAAGANDRDGKVTKTQGKARSELEKMRQRSHRNVAKMHEKSHRQVEKLREKANRDVAKILEKAWGSYRPEPRIEPVVINPEPPVNPPVPVPEPIEDRLIEVEPVPVPQPAPEPAPLVDEMLIQDELPPVRETSNITIYGLTLPVTKVGRHGLTGIAPGDVSRFWTELSSDGDYSALVADLQNAKRTYRLCGWALLELSDAVAHDITASASAQAVIQTWILVQLGYDVSLASDGKQLYTIFAADHRLIRNNDRMFVDISSNGKLYSIYQPTTLGGMFYVHDALAPGLVPVDMGLTSLPLLHRVHEYNELSTAPLDVRVEKSSPGMLEFYNNYPRVCDLRGNIVSQWLNYASAPVSDAMAETLVVPLQQKVKGMSEYEAVSTILQFVQQAFPYEYDDVMWGGDRAFFPDETLHYLKCDCEDHAILFTRLVKTITGLPVALLYYPNHLAAAVEFTEPVTGDFVVIDGHRMVVCDPTSSLPVAVVREDMAGSVPQCLRW